jgi:hypothetical protein
LPGASPPDAIHRMTRFAFVASVAFLTLALVAGPAESARGPGTLEDLKKIEIICFVPAWLPKGFKLKSVAVSYDEPGPDEGGGRFPLYNIEYENGHGASFSIDSAREGIGDRNLLDTDDTEDVVITSPLGRMDIIYTPKGKGKEGRKTEIRSNWTSDANMIREKAKDPLVHPTFGRYHGFTATGLTLAEFEKIINSLRAVRP